MHFSTRSRLGLSLLLLLVLATGMGLYTSSRGAAQAAGPRVWLSQKVGPPTASMQLHGNRFGLNETVLAYFDDTTQIGSTTTDATGQFVLRVTVPKTALPGTHTVRATGQSSGLTTLALFLVRTDWSQPGFGPSHTGNNPYENVLTSSNVSALTLDWSHPNISTLPAVAGGVVYVGSNNKLYALDAATGTLRWSNSTVFCVDYSPAVAGGIIYICSVNFGLDALDTTTGALKWSNTTVGCGFSPTAVANGVVYVVGSDFSILQTGYLYALDAATGTLKWSYNTGASNFASLIIANSVVYGCSYNSLYALDAATGILKWSYPAGGCDFSSTPAVVNGVVYFGSYAFHLPGMS